MQKRCLGRSIGRQFMLGLGVVASLVCGPPQAEASDEVPKVTLESFDCDYQSSEKVEIAILDAVAAGEIQDPRQRQLPEVVEREQFFQPNFRGGGVPTVTQADIFQFEDSAGLLLTNFSDGALFNLMSQAANQLMVANGDNFDFIGYFVNFTPDHQLGSAFYLGLENDATGLGQGVYEDRAGLGVAGNNVEGLVMMWNQASWAPDDTAMLVLGQEFEHRWGMFLSNLLDGRSLQGDNGACGRGAHWNWKVDGQGSGMEIREWIGSSPAVLGGDCAPGGFFFICNNTDIGNSGTGLGGVFSHSDLYLMGYDSPAEMDAGNSELRYMDSSNCSSNYNGAISTFGSADIIAANGLRSPDSTTSQQDFRTGWVMIHQPGAAPTPGQLDNVVNILNRWSETWQWSTSNKGTMDNTLGVSFTISFPNGTPDTLIPDQPTTFDVQTTDVSSTPNTSSGLLYYSVDGGAFQTSSMAFLGGNNYQATIPGVPCPSSVEFFVTIEDVSAVVIAAPAGAPTVTLNAVAAGNTVLVLDDDFESDLGWTAGAGGDTATTGIWTRVSPNGTAAQPEDDHTADPATLCFVTGQGAVGGGLGDNDIDGGTTTLLSPIFDASQGATGVSYWRWYSNATGAEPNADIFVVDISNNGGTNWVNVETIGPAGAGTSGGWILHEFMVDDILAATNDMQVRFVASDLAGGSVVEAAVDDFAATIIECLVADPPIITDAVSRVTHGAAGPFDAPMSGGTIIETRDSGVETLVVTFDVPMTVLPDQGVNVSVVGVNSGAYAGSVLASLSGANDVLTITFGPALADVDRYTIDLAGMTSDTGVAIVDSTFEVVALRGDVSTDLIVSTGDASIIKPNFGATVDATNFRFDFNADGVISTGDASIVKPLFGNAAP